MNKVTAIGENKIAVFRWYFYIALTQFLLYFIVPAIIFPNKVVMDVETISALTLGLVVGLFFLVVNIIGLFVDKARRRIYVSLISILGLYFVWAVVSWADIERMEYLLR